MKPAIRCGTDAARRFRRDQEGAQRAASVGVRRQTGRKHGRDSTRRRVNDGTTMGVVVIESVNKCAVQVRRIPLRKTQIHADDRIVSRTADLRERRCQPFGEIKPDRREPNPERVEYVQFSAIQYIARHLIKVEGLDKNGQCFGQCARRARHWPGRCVVHSFPPTVK